MALTVDLSGKTILVCGVARGGIGGATVIALDKEQAAIEPTIETG